ncbi:MAG: hypothetical protein WCH82_08000 [Mycobacteriaceae bacterium]
MKFTLPLTTVALTGLMVFSAAWAGSADAEPAHGSSVDLNDLSQQAQQLTDSMRTAQQDYDRRLQLLGEADRKHDADLVALDAAKAELAGYQGSVDKVAAAVYMGGYTGDITAILTAASPTSLIDNLAVQRSMVTEMTGKVQGLRRVSEELQAVEAASAKSEADAKTALDAVVALRADLQKKQADLRSRIADAAAAGRPMPSAAIMAAAGLAAPVPTVGMGGLVPNARSLAAYIMATYPGVQSIGGVRSDPLPDHPSGHAIDIMIGSDMALGDAINADVQSQAARFGVSYTMWRVANHFNHVHVTVS